MRSIITSHILILYRWSTVSTSYITAEYQWCCKIRRYDDRRIKSIDLTQTFTLVLRPGVGGGGVLSYMSYIGMCGPKGYSFLAVLVINWVSILAILVINRVSIFAL